MLADHEQAVYTPTEEQALAAAAALAIQRQHVQRAEAAPAVLKERSGDESWTAWCGGTSFEQLLETMDLVDARYLVALGEAGGVVPRWQELPQEARITPARLWWLRGWTWTFTLPVLVLSYPWLDREHPDRLGEQLRRIVPILSALLASAREVGGEHQTVGVAWDYACLPQKPYATDGEHERFKRGLSAINRWYSHPHTIVLLCTGALPTGTAYRSVRPYEAAFTFCVLPHVRVA